MQVFVLYSAVRVRCYKIIVRNPFVVAERTNLDVSVWILIFDCEGFARTFVRTDAYNVLLLYYYND